MLNGNPAARLLDVITETLDANRNDPTKAVWMNIFQTGNDQSLMYYRLSQLMLLTDETSALVKDLFPRQVRATDTWKAAIDKGFQNMNMLSAFSTFRDQITETAVDHLTSAADLLDSKGPTTLSQNEIKSFSDTLNNLVSEILQSESEEKVKEYLVRSLRKIIVALEEYRLGGSIPITSSIEQMLGHSFFDKNYSDTLQKTDVGKRILGCLSDLANAVTVATPIVGLLLTDSVKQALGIHG